MWMRDAFVSARHDCRSHAARDSCGTGLPIVGEFAADAVAAEGNDGIGAADGPEHVRHLESSADDSLATGLYNTGAHEEFLGAIPGVAHTFRITLKDHRQRSPLYSEKAL